MISCTQKELKTGSCKLTPKLTWDGKGPRIAKTILKQNNQVRRLPARFQTCHKSSSSQLFGGGVRTDTEASGLEQNPETSPHICGQLVFDKRPSPFNENGRPLQQMALGQLDIYTQKKEGDPPTSQN